MATERTESSLIQVIQRKKRSHYNIEFLGQEFVLETAAGFPFSYCPEVHKGSTCIYNFVFHRDDRSQCKHDR